MLLLRRSLLLKCSFSPLLLFLRVLMGPFWPVPSSWLYYYQEMRIIYMIRGVIIVLCLALMEQ